MMNGASTLEGYVPDVDATVVTRILDAGGTIVGKAHCEYFCLSGGSHTCAAGPVHNPYKLRLLGRRLVVAAAGALVGAGEVEMAIGGDQGGSIRMPASWSGCYGMKATHGLVPYTGVMPIEATIDHTGPMTATVADNALLLEVIAGRRRARPAPVQRARRQVHRRARAAASAGLRIGVVTEGFGRPESEPDVDQKVRAAADRLRALGAIVEEVSIPMHLDGPAIWTPIALEGLQAQMMNGNGMGFNWKGLYTTSLLDAHANWRARANELSRTLKISMMVGEYFIRNYRGHFYAKAQNLARVLRQGLRRRAVALRPAADADAADEGDADPAGERAARAVVPARASRCCNNTCPFDVTGHPAMSVPCGLSQGLAGRHACWSAALRRVDDLPRRARLRAARATGATVVVTQRSRRSTSRNPVQLRLAARRRRRRGCARRATLSYVAGRDRRAAALHHASPQLLDEAVAAPRRARRGDLRRDRQRAGRWYDLQQRADEVAAGLLALGIRRGDRVGIWAPNRDEWLLAQFGTARIGAILVNINPAYRSTELEYALNKVRCRALVMARVAQDAATTSRMLRGLAPEIDRPGDEPAARVEPPAAPASTCRADRRRRQRRPARAQRFADFVRQAGPAQRARLAGAVGARSTPTTRSTSSSPAAPPARPRARRCRTSTSSTTRATAAQAMALGPTRPAVHPGAAVPLLRHGAGRAGLRGAPARRWCSRARASTPRRRSRASQRTAARRCTACRRCSSRCSTHPRLRSTTCRSAAHRHHGRRALPDRDDAARGRRAAHARRSPSPTA